MDIETIRDFCRALPAVTEDIKWGQDLCFSVAGKMFCVAGLEGPLTVSFKVRDEEFDELADSPGMRPAPYVARYKWVLVEEVGRLGRKEWEHYLRQSYDLVRAGCRRSSPGSTGCNNGTHTALDTPALIHLRLAGGLVVPGVRR